MIPVISRRRHRRRPVTHRSASSFDPGAVRVALVAHYASMFIGGEAAIPLHMFRELRARGIDAWLVAHESARGELASLHHSEPGRVIFTPSLPGGERLLRWGERQSDGPRSLAWAITQIERQLAMRPTVRTLVRELGVTVVHQPVGVAPSVPSPFYALGAPVVIGPLNGGMAMPPAFRARDTLSTRLTQAARPAVAAVANRLLPGKLRAGVVMVANERTRAALPGGVRGEVVQLSEIGVELVNWPPKDYVETESPMLVRCVFLGRLVAWKGVDLALRALAGLPAGTSLLLEVVGDGPERGALERLAADLGVTDRVAFHGWLAAGEVAARLRTSDVLVLPSLREAGGAVVLEAMASALPVIVSNWGGPADFVDDDTGIRVSVESREKFIHELSAAMIRLAQDAALRRRLGEAGRRRVEQHYDWARLTDGLVAAYGMVTCPVDADARTSVRG